MLRELLGAGGPSTTKAVYLGTALAAVGAAVLLTLALCWVYVAHRQADPSFAGVVGVVWGTAVGFASRAHNTKAAMDRDAAVAAVKGAP